MSAGAGQPTRAELDAMIAEALAEYDDAVRAAWARIRIEPALWVCDYGSGDEEFWAVAVDGDHVFWFNDVEDGFNWSRFSRRGRIDEVFANQDSFADILERIAQRHSRHAWRSLEPGPLPAELAGSGTVERRQTTYWDVRTAGGAYRIHFRDKRELRFISADYDRAELHDAHPLLADYHEPSRQVFFVDRPRHPAAAASSIDAAIRLASGGWRTVADYGWTLPALEQRLACGFGVVLDGPARICASVCNILDAAGSRTSTVPSHDRGPRPRVLLLGKSYIIAEKFAFERRA